MIVVGMGVELDGVIDKVVSFNKDRVYVEYWFSGVNKRNKDSWPTDLFEARLQDRDVKIVYPFKLYYDSTRDNNT